MRTSYPVCYDISDEKRLRKVFKAMRGYGMAVHSVRLVTLRSLNTGRPGEEEPGMSREAGDED